MPAVLGPLQVTVLDASTVASWIGAPPGASPSAFAPLPSDSDSQRPISSHCPENAPGCLAGGSDRSDEAAHTNESLRGTLSQLFVSQVRDCALSFRTCCVLAAGLHRRRGSASSVAAHVLAQALLRQRPFAAGASL